MYVVNAVGLGDDVCMLYMQAISTKLFTHQKQALCWMIAAENSERLPPFWLQRGTYYYNSLTSFSSQTKPHSIRGGQLINAVAVVAVSGLLSCLILCCHCIATVRNVFTYYKLFKSTT